METPIPGVFFLVNIRAGEKCISVPIARAIISRQGLFAWDVWLPTGTPVVVDLCDGQHELTLFGTVSASDGDSWIAIEFEETTESNSTRSPAGSSNRRNGDVARMLLPAMFAPCQTCARCRERPLEGERTNMAKPPLLVKGHTGPRCICVPGGHALVSASGFFVREVELLAGTPVVVQFCRGQDEVSLSGTVYAHYGDLGLSVEFKERSGLAVERIFALQEPERIIAR